MASGRDCRNVLYLAGSVKYTAGTWHESKTITKPTSIITVHKITIFRNINNDLSKINVQALPTFASALCLCRQLNFSMKLSRNNKLRRVSLFFKGIVIHVLLEVKVKVRYLLKGKIHRRLHPKCRSMHLLFLLGPLISHLLSILAPAFSFPLNVLHCGSSYNDLHVVLFLFSFNIFSVKHMRTLHG